jgi:hypothetical protein
MQISGAKANCLSSGFSRYRTRIRKFPSGTSFSVLQETEHE